jgi:DNA-binding protein HU-beta
LHLCFYFKNFNKLYYLTTKTQLTSELAEKSGTTRTIVSDVLDHLQHIAQDQLKKSGVFTIPGLVKLSVKLRKATPARPGRNPATGEAMTISAKPARKTVRARVLKAAKEAV